MNPTLMLGAAALLAASMTGCAPNPKSGRGFHMPQGDAARGQAAFVTLGCTECHRVDGVTLPEPARRGSTIVVLGGEVSHVRTYGELVTAIIHPTRAVSILPVAEGIAPVTKSPMPDINAQMTVAQLIDLVTFLEPTYRQKVVEYHAEGYPLSVLPPAPGAVRSSRQAP